MRYLFVLLLLLSSCSVERQALKKLNWVEYKAPRMIAKKCAEKHPTKTITKIEKEYLQGEVITIHDSIELDCDTVTIEKYKDRKIRVPYPVMRTRVDTYKVKVTDTIQNTAKIDLLELDLESALVDIRELESKVKAKNKRLMYLYILLALILGIVGLRFYLKTKI